MLHTRCHRSAAFLARVRSPGSRYSPQQGEDGGDAPGSSAGMATLHGTSPEPNSTIARAVAFAIEQPPDIDVSEIMVRPTARG